MRTVTALDVRRRFGQIVDDAAAGERTVIERAGQPVAALVPLSDLALLDPDRRRATRLAAIEDIRQLAARRPFPEGFDVVDALRTQRRSRAASISQAAPRSRGTKPG
jgi:prevent-host-death family protein